jgi:hypothetical protein
MSILDNLEVSRLMVDKPVTTKLTCIQDTTQPVQMQGFGVRRGWKMRMAVETTFFCVDAQKDVAFRNAEKLLLQMIHKGSLRHIAAIRQAIYSGDDDIAVALLDELQSTFGL